MPGGKVNSQFWIWQFQIEQQLDILAFIFVSKEDPEVKLSVVIIAKRIALLVKESYRQLLIIYLILLLVV